MSLRLRSPLLALPLLALLAGPAVAQQPQPEQEELQLQQDATAATPDFLSLYQRIQQRIDLLEARLQDAEEESPAELAQIRANIQQLEAILLEIRQLAIRLNAISGVDPLQSLRLDDLPGGLQGVHAGGLEVPGGKRQQLQQVLSQLNLLEVRLNAIRAR